MLFQTSSEKITKNTSHALVPTPCLQKIIYNPDHSLSLDVGVSPSLECTLARYYDWSHSDDVFIFNLASPSADRRGAGLFLGHPDESCWLSFDLWRAVCDEDGALNLHAILYAFFYCFGTFCLARLFLVGEGMAESGLQSGPFCLANLFYVQLQIKNYIYVT